MPGFETIGKEEKKALNQLFEEGGILFAHGFEKLRKKYHVRDFESKFASFMNAKYGLAVTSGTSAIKIGLKALGVKPGDHVITQSFNFIATVEAILDCGAKPIIVNIDDTLNMCVDDLKKKITKKTKVIIPVHMLGVSVEFDQIQNIAKKNNIKILEDNCETLMGKYKNKYLGTLGDVGVLSLDFGKFITSGEGGIILTNNKKIEKYCREYHDHGHENNPKFSRGNDTKKIFGFNYRMTEMQAVVGKVQLKKIKKIFYEGRKRYLIIDRFLNKSIKRRKIPQNSIPNFDTFIFFVDNNIKKKQLLNYLNRIGLGTKNIPSALKWHCSYYWDHIFSKKEITNFKKTNLILKKSIAIPISLNKSIIFYKNLAKKINEILQ
tara:strand:+ start:739 stop:1872 length:1134 start_codon:yes stop_codon:yes gene_type:complete